MKNAVPGAIEPNSGLPYLFGGDKLARDAALRGALLAFGGARGANVALMREVLAAGLTAANWSLDAPPFDRGGRSPCAGLLVAAIAPRLIAPDFPQRLRLQLERLAGLGIHIPGRRSGSEEIELPDELVAEIENATGS